MGELEEAERPDVPLDPVFLPFAAKRALFEEPVCADEQVQFDRVGASVSFMGGATAAFDFMGRPERQELRARLYAEFGLSEAIASWSRLHSWMFTHLCLLWRGAVATFMECGVGAALPCTLTLCCQRHREFRMLQRACQ